MQTSRAQLSVQLSVLLATVCAVFLLIGGAADAEAPPPPVTSYVVTPGDTLWDIAARHVEAGEDVRVLIHAIRDRSGLDSSLIRPGQVLQIPSG